MTNEKPPLTLTRQQLHDLRASLGAISMAISIIEKESAEKNRAWVEMIKNSSAKGLAFLGSVEVELPSDYSKNAKEWYES